MADVLRGESKIKKFIIGDRGITEDDLQKIRNSSGYKREEKFVQDLAAIVGWDLIRKVYTTGEVSLLKEKLGADKYDRMSDIASMSIYGRHSFEISALSREQYRIMEKILKEETFGQDKLDLSKKALKSYNNVIGDVRDELGEHFGKYDYVKKQDPATKVLSKVLTRVLQADLITKCTQALYDKKITDSQIEGWLRKEIDPIKENVVKSSLSSAKTTGIITVPLDSEGGIFNIDKRMNIIGAEAALKEMGMVNKDTAQEIKDKQKGGVANDPVGLCLTPDSLIQLVDGVKRRLIEIKVGDSVLSLNQETGKLEPHQVKALLDMGVKPVYKLTTQSGKSLKTTLNHPYLTRNGWRKLKEIGVGEEIVVLNSTSFSEVSNSSFNNLISDEKAACFIKENQRFFSLFEREPFIMQGVSNDTDTSVDFNPQFFAGVSGVEVIGENYGRSKFIGNINDIFFSGMKLKTLDNLFDFRDNFFFGMSYFKVGPAGYFLDKSFVLGPDFRDDTGRSIDRGKLLEQIEFVDLVQMDKRPGINNDFFHVSGPISDHFEQPDLDAQRASPNPSRQDEPPSAARYVSLDIAPRPYRSTFSLNRFQSLQRLPLQVFPGETPLFLLTFQSLHLAFDSSLSDISITSANGPVKKNIVVADSIIAYEPIAQIKYLGRQQVYDIEVEGTHNFVAEGIVAHNTYTQKTEGREQIADDAGQTAGVSGKQLVNKPVDQDPIEQMRLRNLIESIQRKKIDEYTSKLKVMSFDQAIAEVKQAFSRDEEKEILISEPLTIERLKQLAYLPFEVGLLRLRGTRQWVMRRGKALTVDLKFAVIAGDDETSLLGDILIHNHPNQDKPMVSGGDIFNQFFNVGISAWAIGNEGMQFYNADSLRYSEDEEENLDLNYWVLETRIPKGRFKKDSEGRYTEEALSQIESIYKELNITFGFIPFAELTMEDLAKDSKDLYTALRSPIRKERYLALKQVLNMAQSNEITAFLGRFAQDGSHTIQEAALQYLEKRFNPADAVMVRSIKAFTESRFNDIKIKAFEILFSHLLQDDYLLRSFAQLITQNGLWEILSQIKPSPNVADIITQNYGARIRLQLPDTAALNNIKLSPVTVEVMLQLNLSDLFLEYLNQMKNIGAMEKLEEVFGYLGYSDRGREIIIDFVDRHYSELDWDLQLRTAETLSDVGAASEVVSRFTGRIPFDYFHRTFQNSKVEPGGGKSYFFMREGVIDKYISDPNPSIVQRAKIMKFVWDRYARYPGSNMTTNRKIYLDAVRKESTTKKTSQSDKPATVVESVEGKAAKIRDSNKELTSIPPANLDSVKNNPDWVKDEKGYYWKRNPSVRADNDGNVYGGGLPLGGVPVEKTQKPVKLYDEEKFEINHAQLAQVNEIVKKYFVEGISELHHNLGQMSLITVVKLGLHDMEFLLETKTDYSLQKFIVIFNEKGDIQELNGEKEIYLKVLDHYSRQAAFVKLVERLGETAEQKIMIKDISGKISSLIKPVEADIQRTKELKPSGELLEFYNKESGAAFIISGLSKTWMHSSRGIAEIEKTLTQNPLARLLLSALKPGLSISPDVIIYDEKGVFFGGQYFAFVRMAVGASAAFLHEISHDKIRDLTKEQLNEFTSYLTDKHPDLIAGIKEGWKAFKNADPINEIFATQLNGFIEGSGCYKDILEFFIKEGVFPQWISPSVIGYENAQNRIDEGYYILLSDYLAKNGNLEEAIQLKQLINKDKDLRASREKEKPSLFTSVSIPSLFKKFSP